MKRVIGALCLLSLVGALMSQSAACGSCDPEYWDCDWKPPTPGPTPAPTLPNPNGVADCGYGTLENFDGEQYWGRILKTDGAGRMTVVNVRKADDTRPKPDLDSHEMVELEAWGLRVHEGREEEAAAVQAAVTPPGSTVKFLVASTDAGTELWDADAPHQASIANEHNWSLNHRLIEAGVASPTSEGAEECLGKTAERVDRQPVVEETKPVTWERISEDRAKVTFGSLDEGMLYEIAIEDEAECMGPLGGRNFHIAGSEEGEATIEVIIPATCGQGIPEIKGWMYQPDGTRMALHAPGDQ